MGSFFNIVESKKKKKKKKEKEKQKKRKTPSLEKDVLFKLKSSATLTTTSVMDSLYPGRFYPLV